MNYENDLSGFKNNFKNKLRYTYIHIGSQEQYNRIKYIFQKIITTNVL